MFDITNPSHVKQRDLSELRHRSIDSVSGLSQELREIWRKACDAANRRSERFQIKVLIQEFTASIRLPETDIIYREQPSTLIQLTDANCSDKPGQWRDMFTIDFARSVSDDVAKLRAADRERILDRIDAQLMYEPTKPTRHRKILLGLVPPWEHKTPTWELRVGEYRVFYDVDEEMEVVTVQAIRHKPPHKTLEEIL